MKIVAHVLIKNEARFVWYAIMSVIDHVDRVRIWDTGSTDETLTIIKSIMSNYKGKTEILFRKVKEKEFSEGEIRQKMVEEESYPFIRQKMLDVSICDWIVVVDGDEVWFEDSIKRVTETIRKRWNEIESIIVPSYNLVGDIYHYQEREAGRYHFFDKIGHYSLKAFSRHIPGLHSSTKPHGRWGWEDEDCKMIQCRDPKKMVYLNAPFLHATHLKRAGNLAAELKVFKRAHKLKHELGTPFPKDFYYPEVFFEERPAIVPSPWERVDRKFYFISYLETPFRKIKRRLINSLEKKGLIEEKIGY